MSRAGYDCIHKVDGMGKAGSSVAVGSVVGLFEPVELRTAQRINQLHTDCEGDTTVVEQTETI